MNRRSLLASGIALGSTVFVNGCTTVADTGIALPGPQKCLSPVNVSQDRVIRQLVGLRPYRPTGFVVRREALGDKQIVHNYGHGGGGITLAWGSSRLAVDLALQDTQGPVAVLGAGIMGLTTARLLQEAGRSVTIYTSQLPPNTTSNIAGGQWYPSSVFRRSLVTSGFQQQFIAAANYSYKRYQIFVGEQYGVRWLQNYELSSSPIGGGLTDQLIASMVPAKREIPPDQNPFGTKHLRRWNGMYIEPSRFLRQLERDILISGGKIGVRHFADQSQIQELPQKLICNCTGLGSAKLFGDDELVPVRGQLEVLLPQPEIDYAYTTRNGLYMFPRSDGIVLGGTYDQGETDLTPDPETARNIINGHSSISKAMRCA
ncbi:FAD-dependent oxidoreductase [Parasphingorhabdus halotolerans]|uniref:D-amino-acid oxidase n=1 Tax=Parasphingorhabdus halotolerans TaxID=2725558 RepID=A0A6H2DSB0_9SPHN|nr:FAD-dependent oxidoreductase [Parasphingorhabdus halotolerans]